MARPTNRPVLGVLAIMLAAGVSACTDFGRWDLLTDPLPPVLTEFTLSTPNPTVEQTIGFVLAGEDNVLVSGWLINESSTMPSVSDVGWTEAKPSAYTLSAGFGTKTVYAWARDPNGNISSSRSFSITVTFENTEWNYRVPITVSSAQVPEDLADFPVYANLAELAATEFFDRTRSDGRDIVVTASDGLTRLSRELIGFDAVSKQGQLWFKAPALSSGTNTPFYLYYGHSFQEANETAVWSNGYVAVWHLEESGAGIPDEYQDSSPYGNHGRGGGGVESSVPMTAGGQIGGGQEFATDDYIDVAVASILSNLGPVTFSFWVQPSASSGRVFEKGQGAGARFSNSGVRMNFYRPRATSEMLLTRTGASTAGLQHLALTYDGGTDVAGMRILRNGAVMAAVSGASGSGDLNDDSAGLFRLGNATWTSERCLNGILDEFRISNVIRSDAWIQAEYNNQNDPAAFSAFGPEEIVP